MRVHSRGLNRGERLACTKAQLKCGLPKDLVEWISLAGLYRHFQLESRTWRDPEIQGRVVLSATAPEDGFGFVLLYVIPDEEWCEELTKDFLSRILPAVDNWLKEMYRLPDTGMCTLEKILVELHDGKLSLRRLQRKAES